MSSVRPTDEHHGELAPRPHDLLTIDPGAFETDWRGSDRPESDRPEPDWAEPDHARSEVSAPLWVEQRLSDLPVVVVRRGAPVAGRIPVGVRGAGRNERCAGYVAAGALRQIMRPEDLAGSLARLEPHPELLASANIAARVLDEEGLAWGPTGAAGFELATGACVLRPSSDLDLVIDAPGPLAPAVLGRLAVAFAKAPSRIDAQLRVPEGFVQLEELAGAARAGAVLLRHDDGTTCLGRPWAS